MAKTQTKSSLSAKGYRNKKNEARVQLSGLQADFVKIVKQDEEILEDVKEKVTQAIKNMPPPSQTQVEETDED